MTSFDDEVKDYDGTPRLRVYLSLHGLSDFEFATLIIIANYPTIQEELLAHYNICSQHSGTLFAYGNCLLNVVVPDITESDTINAVKTLRDRGFIREFCRSDLDMIFRIPLHIDEPEEEILAQGEDNNTRILKDQGATRFYPYLILTDLGQKHWEHVASCIFSPHGGDAYWSNYVGYWVSPSPPNIGLYGCPVDSSNCRDCLLFKPGSPCKIEAVYNKSTMYWWRNEFLSYSIECRRDLNEGSVCSG